MQGSWRAAAAALVVTIGCPAGAGSQAPTRGPQAIAARVDEAASLLSKNATAAAFAIIEPLLSDPAVLGDASLHGDVLFYAGLAQFQRNNYAEALDLYTAAVNRSREAGKRLTEARALLGIGQCYKNQGLYARSLESLRLARSRFDAIGERDGAARAWMVIASVEDLTGRHRDALQSYERAERLFGDATHAMRIRLLNEIGITYKNLGEYEAALDHYQRALAAQVANGDRYGQAVTLHNTAVVYGLLGEPERAIEHYQRSLAIAREIGERRGQTVVLGNLGELLLDRGDVGRAFDYFQRQLTLTRELGSRNEQALALFNLGRAHAAAGDLPRARQLLTQAVALQREIGARTREAATLIALADLELRADAPAAGERLAREALAIAQSGGVPELEWRSRFAVARAARGVARRDEAIAHLKAGVAIVNDLRANVQRDRAKVGFVDERQAIFHALASVQVEAGRSGAALEAAEAGRARAFADLLEQRRTLGRPAARAHVESVRAAIDELRAANAAAGPSRADELRRAGDALASGVGQLRERDGELASLITAESPGTQEILAIARRLEAVIVEYLVTDRAVLAWTVSPDSGITATAIPVDRTELAALTSSPPRSETLRQLHRLLIEPIEARLPRSAEVPVVIVPDGPLALVPFAALTSGSGVPLAERHTLSAAPSISIYRYTFDKQRRAAAAAPALVVADPSGPAGSALAPLPSARDEGRAVVRRLAPAPAQLLSGAAATESEIKRASRGRPILHFATHGLVSGTNPLASSLVLAPGGGDDGYLRASEVFDLELSADLVVLSGCSTGAGPQTGDGIAGLARAFIYAGTPRVLVSLWDVNDRSTAYLMDRFYAARSSGQPPAAALRMAQLDTRRRYPDADDWAAFVLIGEPR